MMNDQYGGTSGIEEEGSEEEEGAGRVMHLIADTLFIFDWKEDGTWGLVDHAFAEEDNPRVIIDEREVIFLAGENYLMTRDAGDTPYLQDHIYREW